jgi:hypothetical protein
MSRGPFRNLRPLSLAAIDAALSETLGKPVRRDRLARDDRVYRWIVRRAIVEGSLRFRTTYAECAAGAGYEVPRLNCRPNRKRARQLRVSTVYRALNSLEAAGLVRFHGEKREDGRWRCLSVGLTPAAYGPCPPFGRSRRRPTRRPDGRISFLRRNGTSPPVETSKRTPEVRERSRARARDPGKEAPRGGGAFLAAALAAPKSEESADPRRPWPHERFDLTDPRAVLLVEAFEAEFDRPAKFSYKRNGPVLTRILDRLDRFTAGPPHGWDEARDRYRPGAGYEEAAALVRRWGHLSRVGRPDGRPAAVASLAYFLPKLDQLSKRRRREWKQAHRKDRQ